jgi:hypothetical protein
VSDGYAVETEQLRAHAANLEELVARFDAVKNASAYIAGDAAAYGLLCGWMAAVLESRHTEQDELLAYVQENLSLAAEGLYGTADNYDAADTDAVSLINTAGGLLSW